MRSPYSDSIPFQQDEPADCAFALPCSAARLRAQAQPSYSSTRVLYYIITHKLTVIPAFYFIVDVRNENDFSLFSVFAYFSFLIFICE